MNYKTYILFDFPNRIPKVALLRLNSIDYSFPKPSLFIFYYLGGLTKYRAGSCIYTPRVVRCTNTKNKSDSLTLNRTYVSIRKIIVSFIHDTLYIVFLSDI